MAFTTPETFSVGQQPTAAEMNLLVTAITELQTAASSDSGWQTITIQSGFAASSQAPQCRKINGRVVLRGAFANTGLSASSSGQIAGVLPSGYEPPQFMAMASGASTAATAGQVAISTNGNIDIRTGSSLSAYYRLDGISWLVD